MFNFTRCGSVVVEETGEEAVFEAAMEAGADDVAPLPDDEEGRPSTSYRVSEGGCAGDSGTSWRVWERRAVLDMGMGRLKGREQQQGVP